jgi:hypothetical protein
MTSWRERLSSTVAGQLGRPHGILSPLVARALNRGNQRAIAGAVEAAQAPRAGVAADIGFGGGVGLQLLSGRGGHAVIGIGDPDVMAQLPFTSHGFTIRPVGEIAAALQNSGLQVEQRRIDDKPIPRHLFIGRRD